jgi:acyl transferase domain-containing protein/acyl carrier protein
MLPVLEDFRKVAKSVKYQSPRIKFYSNVTGKPETEDFTKPDYWVQHIMEPVQFNSAFESILKDGHDLYVEVGPKHTLLELGKKIAAGVGNEIHQKTGSWLPMMKRGQIEHSQFLSALGGFWCSGGNPAWEKLSTGLTDVPMYPFQRRRHWREVQIDGQKVSGKQSAEVFKSPLLGRRFGSPLLKERFYETTFSLAEIPMLDEHRIFDELVVAGASHLALVIAAAENEYNQSQIVLNDILFPQALVIPEIGSRTVQLMINSVDENQHESFRLISFGAEQSETAVHATGKISTQPTVVSSVNWDQLQNKCDEKIDVQSVYKVQADRHIVVGESYKWLKSVTLGRKEAIAELNQPDVLADSQGFSLHPGLIDSCFGILIMTAQMDVEETFIPFSMEALQLYRPAGNDLLRVYARLNLDKSDSRRIVGDITIETKSGEKIADFIGLEGRQAGKNALLSRSDSESGMLYETVWSEVKSDPKKLNEEDVILIIHNDVEKEKTLVSACRSTGCRVIEVTKSAKFEQKSDDHFALNSLEKDHLSRLLESIGANLTCILNFATTNSKPNDSEVENAQKSVVLPFINLIQAFDERSISCPVINITTGSAMVLNSDKVHQPLQSAITGLIRSAQIEHPELKAATIDVDSAELSGNTFFSALNEAFNGESDIACRGDKVYTSRLKKISLKSRKDFNPDGVFLVTGGTGAIGLTLSDWLISKGVRALILTGRRELSPQQIEQLEQMRSNGVDVHYVKADISKFDEFSDEVKKLGNFQNIKGVFHLAGELEDGLLAGMQWDQFYKPFQAKVQGAINLNHQTSDHQLNHFVMFSSVVAVTGSAGQSNYAAANAVLDTIAIQRRQNGQCGLSLNWGPWAELGMASKLDKLTKEKLTDSGIRFIQTKNALSLLDKCLTNESPAQIGILDIEWSRFNATRNSLLADLMPKKSKVKSETLLDQLKRLDTGRRVMLVQSTLIKMLSDALKLKGSYEIDTRERLFDLGVDSLIAVELKNKLQAELGLPISSTLLFDYPTVESLTNYVLNDLLLSVLKSTSDKATPSQAHQMDSISEDEAELALLEELSKFKGQK